MVQGSNHIKIIKMMNRMNMTIIINYIFGQVRRLTFVGVNFLVKFTDFGHIHLVILMRSCEHSSIENGERPKIRVCRKSFQDFFLESKHS